MAERLDFTLEAFGPAALKGEAPVTINSLCTVFAESEVIGLINRNCRREDIALAVHKSVIKKLTGMYRRIVLQAADCVLVGGGAMNPGMASLFKATLACPLTVPDNPQIVTALGAALLAAGK